MRGFLYIRTHVTYAQTWMHRSSGTGPRHQKRNIYSYIYIQRMVLKYKYIIVIGDFQPIRKNKFTENQFRDFFEINILNLTVNNDKSIIELKLC